MGTTTRSGAHSRRWSMALVTTALLLPAGIGGLATSPALAGPRPPAASPSAVVPGADWVVDTPASHGIDPGTLDKARTYAFADGRHTQGVVVVHRGAIVAEWYAQGAGKDSWAASWSVGKSFASALIGIAIGEGLIPSVDVPMTTYFPEWAGTPREAITLRHVLHMESGLKWNEDYDPASLGTSDVITLTGTQPDQLDYAASRPYESPPGTRFNYTSGGSMLLSGVIAKATGMPADEYARRKLFDPIGIRQVEWWRDAKGHTLTYCCVDTTTRNFARFGLLYLMGGSWGAQQVVPATWVDASVTDTAASFDGYGYQWWLSEARTGVPAHFAAVGHDGQYIYVIPSLDLVVVRNGTYVKSPCPPVADPNLIFRYPPDNLVPGQGTIAPDSWSDSEFLKPIVESITGASLKAAAPAGPGDRNPSFSPQAPHVQAQAGCPSLVPPDSTTTSSSSIDPAATNAAVTVAPTFTG